MEFEKIFGQEFEKSGEIRLGKILVIISKKLIIFLFRLFSPVRYFAHAGGLILRLIFCDHEYLLRTIYRIYRIIVKLPNM